MFQIDGQETVGEKGNNEEPPPSTSQVNAEGPTPSRNKKAKVLINVMMLSINITEYDEDDSFDAF